MQIPFVIVQRNVALVPTGRPVKVLVGDVGEVIVALPLTTDQAPLPIEGLFPAKCK